MGLTLDLNGTWELGICSDETYRGLGYEIDMERSGLIPDPFMGMNLRQEHDREMNHLFYGKTSEIEPEVDKDYFLEFDGIDTVAEIYVNGKMLLKVDNMLMTHRIPIAVAGRQYEKCHKKLQRNK